MKLENLTSNDIRQMSYNELIGLTKETNRPPGGISSIMEIAQNTFLDNHKKVLEVGTSTGFTAVELARLTQAKITAIDINPVSLSEAQERAIFNQVENNIHFEKQDVTLLPYENELFDLIFIGNVFSLVSDRKKALLECSRVLKKDGFLAAIPMYYVKKPSEKLLKDVSSAIQVEILPLEKSYWMSFFDEYPFRVCFEQNYHFNNIDSERVEKFVEMICSREHLKKLPGETLNALKDIYRQYMHLFRDNLSHMGFTVLILRKEFEYDEELFVATKI